jgi:hypothetical protein
LDRFGLDFGAIGFDRDCCGVCLGGESVYVGLLFGFCGFLEWSRFGIEDVASAWLRIRLNPQVWHSTPAPRPIPPRHPPIHSAPDMFPPSEPSGAAPWPPILPRSQRPLRPIQPGPLLPSIKRLFCFFETTQAPFAQVAFVANEAGRCLSVCTGVCWASTDAVGGYGFWGGSVAGCRAGFVWLLCRCFGDAEGGDSC